MNKVMITALSALLLGGGFALASELQSSPTATAPTFTNESTTTEPSNRAAAERRTREAGEDVSGPCDEAEHRNDPRCTGGVQKREARDDDDHGRARDDEGEDEVEDVSGPCDEAEHRNDPRCAGGVQKGEARDDDDRERRGNSGPGSDNSGRGGSDD